MFKVHKLALAIAPAVSGALFISSTAFAQTTDEQAKETRNCQK